MGGHDPWGRFCKSQMPTYIVFFFLINILYTIIVGSVVYSECTDDHPKNSGVKGRGSKGTPSLIKKKKKDHCLLSKIKTKNPVDREK